MILIVVRRASRRLAKLAALGSFLPIYQFVDVEYRKDRIVGDAAFSISNNVFSTFQMLRAGLLAGVAATIISKERP
jgi:hypothetical protein